MKFPPAMLSRYISTWGPFSPPKRPGRDGKYCALLLSVSVFGVTILANEVSKETKVSNGSLVNRQGDTVQTQNKAEALSFYEAVEAKTVIAGDIMNIANNLGRVSAVVEGISYLTEGIAIVKVTGATLLFKDADAEMLYVADNADNDMSPLRILFEDISAEEARKLMDAGDEFLGWLKGKAGRFLGGRYADIFFWRPAGFLSSFRYDNYYCEDCGKVIQA